jgi:light-regulated signal transduction histidine kinase (bacteriophytochrome)
MSVRPSSPASELERCRGDLRHFAYVTSHDLSEPLRVMSGYAGMLERRYGDQLDDRGRRYIASIVAGADHMNELLQALLAYSRVLSQPLQAAEVDLDELLTEVLEDLAMTARERAAEITRDSLPTVVADPARIAGVLRELISNALEFSSSAPRVHVGARDGEDAWEIFVRDEGIGIDPAHHERAFELLQRLNPRDDHPGSGAGLTVAREAIRAHGGAMRVRSALGEGSEFSFTLPRSAQVDDPAGGPS